MKHLLYVMFIMASVCNVYAEQNESGYDYYSVYYSNTFFAEHVSNKLDNHLIKQNDELIDDTFSYVYDKISMYMYPDWPFVPYLFFGLGLTAYRNGNYAQSYGVECFLGHHDYKNPFLLCIIGMYARTEDMALNDSKDDYFWFGFHVGHNDNLHVHFRAEMIAGVDPPVSNSMYEFDIMLGWKYWSPFFIKFYAISFTNDDQRTYEYMKYTHTYQKGIIHVVYINNSYELSLGYSMYWENIYYNNYSDPENKHKIDDGTIDEMIYHGGGVTFNLKNLASWLELFGELHVLGNNDRSPHIMVISKIGTRMFF